MQAARCAPALCGGKPTDLAAGTASHRLNFLAACLNRTENPPKQPGIRRILVKTIIVDTLTSKPDMAWKRTVLITVFFISGFASLLYQVSWQRLLTVYYGVSSVSVTLIVSVYLFGLGLGALLGGYLAERVQMKIVLYAGIEAAIAAFGLSSPFLLDALG